MHLLTPLSPSLPSPSLPSPAVSNAGRGSDRAHRVPVHGGDEGRHGHQLLRPGEAGEGGAARHEEEEARTHRGDQQCPGNPG